MDRDQFLQELAKILQMPALAMKDDLPLKSAAWDSVAILSTVALIDEYTGSAISGARLAQCGTISDIFMLIEAAT